jgi:hypothetical protein
MHIHVFFQNPSSTMETSTPLHLYCLYYKYESRAINGVSKQNAHSVKGVFRKAL